MPIWKRIIKHWMSNLMAIVPVAGELFNAFSFSTASSWYSRSKRVVTSAAAVKDKEAHYTLLFLPLGSWWQQSIIRFFHSRILDDNSKSRDSGYRSSRLDRWPLTHSVIPHGEGSVTRILLLPLFLSPIVQTKRLSVFHQIKMWKHECTNFPEALGGGGTFFHVPPLTTRLTLRKRRQHLARTPFRKQIFSWPNLCSLFLAGYRSKPFYFIWHLFIQLFFLIQRSELHARATIDLYDKTLMALTYS